VEARREALFSKGSDLPLGGGSDYLGFKKQTNKNPQKAEQAQQ